MPSSPATWTYMNWRIEAMNLKVRMIGYNSLGQVVYTDCLDTGDFYDGEHVWDRTESILRLNLVKVIGEKFDTDGTVSETWETAFSAEAGEYIGNIATDSDGTIKRRGSYLTETEASEGVNSSR